MRRILVAALALAFAACSRNRLPSADAPVYEDTTRAFYRALAELQVGLLDDAKRDFGKATELVPEEPASWANLGLASLRLGEFDAATPPIEKALSLAPKSSELVFLHGRLQTSRGKLDEGIADYRRAADLDPSNVRVRWALAEEVERAGGPNADASAQQLYEAVLKAKPGNLAAILERARLAAKRSDAAALEDSLRQLQPQSSSWTAPVLEQYQALRTAASSRNFSEAARSVAFLRNLLVRVPLFRESLAAVRTPTELIADPLETFVRMPSPSPNPSPADEGLTYRGEPAFPELPDGAASVDWNRDFKQDYAICGQEQSLKIFVRQENGAFKDGTPKSEPFTASCFKVWPADVEMDGDLDLIAGVRAAPPVVLRNNGDGTWKQLTPFPGVVGLRAFAWGDIDGDGDADAVLVGERGDLHVFENKQAGEFHEVTPSPDAAMVVAVALGDINGDGRLDIVSLDTNGVVRRTSRRDDKWESEPLGQWPSEIPAAAVGAYRLFVADLDNNGALDVVASGGGKTIVWLAAGGAFQARQPIDADIFNVVDLNGDGMLDLEGRGMRFIGKGTKGYHWQVIRPRAQPTAGDQRINSFAVGGEIEIRSGLLTQKQIIGADPVHFGLGTRTGIDVARIVWPNGIMQADFDRKADQAVVAEQRLKGSCPWVFTYDGTGMRFVTDFLWRSPLGLRINAVDTAGVTQTEDWVKIRGDQLVARHGVYDVRITAELWETHFVDHVSLLVVDHPADTDVFVDERFAREAPALAVHTLTHPRPVAHAWDDSGRDVTDTIAAQDGRYLSTFARGDYQGIAKDHFVEVELGARAQWLVASGWIYPTDSSINVAIGQQHIQPHGIALEAQDERGGWRVVNPDLGFPAGKNKTVLIDLRPIGNARRIRLRTNLEIYWDSLAVADDAARLRSGQAPETIVRLAPVGAELRYRGFSKTDFSRHDVPEIPDYEHLAGVGQRWRDLAGYYTRFGDVRELLSKVDDRYVIMNAGDELRLTFAELRGSSRESRATSRDFVLIGDGWVKDGDYNTTASATVGPLPRHGHPEYAAAKSDSIEDDPVFRAHPEDWRQFHTRFVDPRAFLHGLR